MSLTICFYWQIFPLFADWLLFGPADRYRVLRGVQSRPARTVVPCAIYSAASTCNGLPQGNAQRHYCSWHKVTAFATFVYRAPNRAIWGACGTSRSSLRRNLSSWMSDHRLPWRRWGVESVAKRRRFHCLSSHHPADHPCTLVSPKKCWNLDERNHRHTHFLSNRRGE